MGERKKPVKTAVAAASEELMVVRTMGGRMQVRWDETAQATPHGQLVFFADRGDRGQERPHVLGRVDSRREFQAAGLRRAVHR